MGWMMSLFYGKSKDELLAMRDKRMAKIKTLQQEVSEIDKQLEQED